MLTCLKNWLWLPLLVLFGCALEEHEVETGGHSWYFVGIKDDSTAVVRVEYWESGKIHDHHLMGWDDDFNDLVSTEYCTVRMNSYWRGARKSSIKSLLPDSVAVPEWCDSCITAGRIDGEVYGVKKISLNEYDNWEIALVLVNEKGNQDSLELEWMPYSFDPKNVALQDPYLRIAGELYVVKDGKFPTQRPAYRIDHIDGAIKFTDSEGNYIIYGGEP